MLHLRRASRIVACLLLATMSACHTWQPYTPATPADTELPTRIRLSFDSGQSMELTGARLVGDSAYVGEESPGTTTWIPVSAVVSIEQEEFAVGRTVLVVVGGIGMAIGLLFLAACGSDDAWC